MATTNNSINSVLIGQSSQSAFGDMLVAERNAILQLQFPYNINTEVCSTSVTGSGSVVWENSMVSCKTGAALSSSGQLQSKQNIHYKPGQGITVFFAGYFTLGVTGSTQIIGIGDDVDGFFFGYNGANFGILHRNNGADNWITQDNWNVDVCNGSGNIREALDFTKGNVFKIQYQWLGYGNIFFYIENPTDGAIYLVHRINYPNLNTSTSLSNPSLPLRMKVTNTSNSSNIILRSGSLSAFIEGPISGNDLRFSTSGSKSVTTQANVLTIKNNATFVGKTNKVTIFPDLVSFTVVGNQDSTYRLHLNSTLGGSPSYTDISATTSVVSFDTAGTTVTGGRIIMTFFVAGNGETSFDLSDYKIYLNPSDILTISATSSGAAITASASLSWIERL